MASDKLQSVKKIYTARERKLAQALAQARIAKEKQEAQAESLRGMLSHYRKDHLRAESMRPDRLAMFHRFYQQVVDTLTLHGRHVDRLGEAEARRKAQWQSAYHRRAAIDRLIEKKAQEADVLVRRRGRRPGAVNPQDWSMLNLHEDN